jgi:hypothetical protein
MGTSNLVDPLCAAPAPHIAADPLQLDRSLAFGLRLVDTAEAFALQLGSADLGDIELPPALGSAADQENLRLTAPLYLASELEAARLLPAVEKFAGIFVSGGIQTDLGSAAETLVRFWRDRQDRLSLEERQAIFKHLFGRTEGPSLASDHGPNSGFEELFTDLAEALASLDQTPAGIAAYSAATQARIRTGALALAYSLGPRSVAASFAARNLLEALQAALDILKHPAVQRAAWATSAWTALTNLAERYLGERPDIVSHIARGRSGQFILAWLARNLPQVDSSSSLASAGDPVVSAAHEWLEASRTLAQSVKSASVPR